jgi:hypothetical protein
VKKQDAYCLKHVSKPWFSHLWINCLKDTSWSNSLTFFFFRIPLTTMSSQPVKSKKSRVHTKEKGTERCGHQCEGRICVNGSGVLDWKKEGSALPRHEKSMTKHPHCNDECPSYENLRPSARGVTSQPGASRSRSRAASRSSSKTLSVPAGTSERSSSLGGFDMDVDQIESLPTEGITGWYLFIITTFQRGLAFLTFSVIRQSTFHSCI